MNSPERNPEAGTRVTSSRTSTVRPASDTSLTVWSLARTPAVWAAVFVVCGTLLRIAAFLQRPSFWEDEASLVVNILQRSFPALASPLDFEQAAPVGFLWLQKLSVKAGGATEYALRSLPLVAGTAVLPLFWTIARRLVQPWAAVVALALVSLSPSAVRYANEAKQYGVEMFVTVVLLAPLAFPAWLRMSNRNMLRLAVCGVGAVALSVSSVFVLACLWAAVAMQTIRQRGSREEWIRLAVLAVVWMAAFAATYALVYSHQAQNSEYMQRFWAPVKLTEQQTLAKAVTLVVHGYIHPLIALDDRVPGPVFLLQFTLLLTSIVTLFRTTERTLQIFAAGCLAGPVLAALAGQWVFASRVMLFSAPLTALLTGRGAWVIAEWSGRMRLSPRVVLAAIAAALLAFPAKASLYVARYPERQSMRAAVEFSLREQRSGDAVYLYTKSVPAWIIYSSDWSRPDVERAAWLTRASALTGPNAGNKPPRGHSVEREGFDLRRAFRGGWELVGIADGIFRSSAGPAPGGPDPGWSDNEFARLTMDAKCRRAILVGMAPGERGFPDLLNRFESGGARKKLEFKATAALVTVFDCSR